MLQISIIFMLIGTIVNALGLANDQKKTKLAILVVSVLDVWSKPSSSILIILGLFCNNNKQWATGSKH